MTGIGIAMAGSLLLLAADKAVPTHVLLVAAETLVQRSQLQATGTVVRTALASPGLTRTERARLRLVDAILLAEVNDPAGVRRVLDDALRLDRTVAFTIPVSAELRERLEDARSMLPPASGPPPATGEVVGREPPARSLSRVVDQLYASVQIEAADLVLQVGWQYAPFARDDEVQLAVRKGVVKADLFEDAEARRAFQRALDLDRSAKLPDYAPPKTVRQFEEMREALSKPQASAKAPTPPERRPSTTQQRTPDASVAPPRQAGSTPSGLPTSPPQRPSTPRSTSAEPVDQPAPPAPTTPRGVVKFDSSLARFNVFIDDEQQPKGSTPLTLSLPEGAHRIRFDCSRLSRCGYPPSSFKINVQAGKYQECQPKWPPK